MYMKNITPYIYLAGSLFIPMTALAHGEVDDGHVEAASVSNPEQRMMVLVVVLIVFALMGFFVWHARRKDAPTPTTLEQKDGTTPPV